MAYAPFRIRFFYPGFCLKPLEVFVGEPDVITEDT